MRTFAVSALVGAIVAFAIGVAVFLRDRRRAANVHFTALCCGLCLWQAAEFLSRALGGDVFRWLAHVFSVPLPLLALRFFQRFLADDPRRVPPLSRALAGSTVVALGVLAYAALIYPIHRVPWFGRALAIFLFAGFGLALQTIAARYRATRNPGDRQRLLYLLVGAAAALVGAVVPPVGTVVMIAYLYFVSQSLFRYRLLDLNELLGRMVVLAVLLLALAGLYGVLLAWVSTGQPGLFFFNTIIASFVIIILFEPLRTLVEDRVNRWLFRQRFELRLRVEKLRRELASVIDLGELVRRSLRELERTERVTHAAVYLLDRQGAGYDLAGAVGPRPEERIDVATRRPFFDRVRREGLVAYETLAREKLDFEGEEGKAAETEEVLRAMDAMNASLVLPLMAGDHVLGLLCVRDERMREAYSTAEIEILRGLAAQISITLQNSQAYEQMRERERLATLGVMAAGLAHEIRNPLGAIKGAAQLIVAPPLPVLPGPAASPAAAGGDGHPPPGGNEEFLGIIIDEVNRLNRVVSQFLDYARPDRGERQAVDLNEEVRRSAQLLEKEAAGSPAPVEIALEMEEGVPPVRVDAEQMRQVFLNLGLNALQAMGERGGRLAISTRRQRGARRGEPASFVEVRFRDTGPGIPPDGQKNIFNPFYTTKEKGTGLGLAICQRILENHGGAIGMKSQVGVGTTFTVLLPVGDDTTTRTLPPAAPQRDA